MLVNLSWFRPGRGAGDYIKLMKETIKNLVACIRVCTKTLKLRHDEHQNPLNVLNSRFRIVFTLSL